MRKRPSNALISEAVYSLPEVGKMLSKMIERIERLEAEVFGTGAAVVNSPSVKRGKGRRPRLEQEELIHRRDPLTNWLERNWPYLSIALRKAKNSRQAIRCVILTRSDSKPAA
jgi:hypothetical protein